MRDPLMEDERHARAGVEGRVAFVAAALILAGGLVAVIDRVGAPARLVTVLAPAIAMSALVALGFVVQTTRISNFYAANRVLPAKYVGLSMAGLAAALIPPMLPPGPPGGSHAAMLAGLAGGLALAGFASGPLLRRSGAFSLPDLFGIRFESRAIRWSTAMAVAAVSGLVAMAGLDGAVRGLEEALGVARFPAAVLAGFVMLTIVAPGGLSGSAWAAAVAAFLLAIALLTPIVILAWGGSPLPAPFGAGEGLWDEALARMATWSAPVELSPIAAATTSLAAALGVAALAPLLSPMIGCRNARSSPRAGIAGVGWLLLLAAALVVGLALSALTLDALTLGRRPDDLPAFLYAASQNGLITICGQEVAGARAAALACSGLENFSGRLGTDDVWASGRYLLTGLPELGRLSLAMSGLVAASCIAAALALAAAGVQACAATLGHDLLFGGRQATALASRRLAAGRLMMIVLSLAITYFVAAGPAMSQNLLTLAVVFAATAIAPLLVLSAWPRATAADAALTLGAGVWAGAVTVAMGWRDGAFDMRIVAAGALAGFLVAATAGFATSLRRKASETRPGRIFVESLRYGDGEVLGADRHS